MRYDQQTVGVASTVSSAAVTRTARRAIAWCLLGAGCLAPSSAVAADLRPRTAQAYETYAADATRNFLARALKTARATTRRCDGVITARAGNGDGILNVPDGLIHHWLGVAFIQGARLAEANAVARDYPAYSKIYKSVVSSKVISQQGDDYRVQIRIKEDAGLTAVLDVSSAVDYRPQKDGSIMAVSRSEEIRQVENAGRPNELRKPVGRDDGYLWRAHTFTHFVPEEGGVLVVMETLGLSRRFPRGLGWLIEPIARRLGRKSVEESLLEFGAAIRRSAGLSSATSACN